MPSRPDFQEIKDAYIASVMKERMKKLDDVMQNSNARRVSTELLHNVCPPKTVCQGCGAFVHEEEICKYCGGRINI
jgi:hypothetical protein